MHATLPSFPLSIQHLLYNGMKDGERTRDLDGIVDLAGGRILAEGMAVLLKLGFGFLLRDGVLDTDQDEKARAFFQENFVMTDPNAAGGIRYYQGKFLIRTRKARDHMNVWLRFCPDPQALFRDSGSGPRLNPLALVSTETLSEEKADRIEKDPDKVDLILRFKDVESILGLIGRADVDAVGLLLENLIQITGNFGHLFKFGAIGKNAELLLDLP